MATRAQDFRQGSLMDLLDNTPEGRFCRFHHANPDVYTTLVRLARERRSRFGRTKVGMQQLFEVMRWDIAIRTGTDDFKINNNYAAYYARLIMAQETDLADAFEIRKSNAGPA